MEGVEDNSSEAFGISATDVSGTSRLTFCDQVFSLKQLEARINEIVMGSSNGKDIPNLSKGEELSEKVVSSKEYEEEDLKDHCFRNSTC